MSKILKIIPFLTLPLLSCVTEKKGTEVAETLSQSDFSNLINIKNIPSEERQRDLNLFADQGSWIGYSLPENQSRYYNGSFIGPFRMNGKGWIARSLADPVILVDGTKYDMARNLHVSEYLPGKLRQEVKDTVLQFTTELCMIDGRSSITRATIRNVSEHPITVSFNWTGGYFDPEAKVDVKDQKALYRDPKDGSLLLSDYLTAKEIIQPTSDSLTVTELKDKVINPGEEYTSYFTQTYLFSDSELADETRKLQTINPWSIFKENEKRWNDYIGSLTAKDLTLPLKHRRVAVKAMMTLLANWRTAAGDLKYDGCYPSYCGFYGFWSWDSWKHASATALFNPELAKNEVRSLFAYQAEDGMIPDFVSYTKSRNNWRDTKPPLAAWAVNNIWKETGDDEFLAEMFDKLYTYHKWWYSHRDHDQNGICEYGSTDGTLIAAAWESGMDNGVRFDETVMLKNQPENAWSMNQENICLNSFLYAEKNILAEMAGKLGKKEVAAQLTKEAEFIKEYVQKNMFDKETGFFYDIRLKTGEPVRVMGAECWLPLWAGIATKEQAREVVAKMTDPAKFNSTVPLGTLDISHPRLRPVRGYWRGPVWIDQVYFGITGLRNYGYMAEAGELMNKYIDNAQGLTGDGPIHENYNPLTGEALNCPNFGWSSAMTIKMLLNN